MLYLAPISEISEIALRYPEELLIEDDYWYGTRRKFSSSKTTKGIPLYISQSPTITL
jgi:hypothetical protein